MKNILIIGGIAHSLFNFRGELIRALTHKGYQVNTASNYASDSEKKKITALGAIHHDVLINRNGLNPLKDVKTLLGLRSLIKKLCPDVILAYTIKPVVWGGIAARVNPEIRFCALVTGLGFSFQSISLSGKLLKRIVTLLYKFSLKNAAAVIFQNPDDKNTFISLGITTPEKCHIVSGSGVDTRHFTPIFRKPSGTNLTFLIVARLLEQKGIRVYYEAANIVKKSYPSAKFNILGAIDSSPNAIKIDEINEWQANGTVKYLGASDDVRDALNDCDIFVLPSHYGEGLPRTIIEAMSMGKPVITTDNVGCREPIEIGKNGFLVPVKNAAALAERMIWFIEHPDAWSSMGETCRQLAITKFDTKVINKHMMQILLVEC